MKTFFKYLFGLIFFLITFICITAVLFAVGGHIQGKILLLIIGLISGYIYYKLMKDSKFFKTINEGLSQLNNPYFILLTLIIFLFLIFKG
jgi:hypothetical protein